MDINEKRENLFESKQAQILAKLVESPMSRKQLLQSMQISTSFLDAQLKKLLEQGLVKYEIVDTREHRPSGMQNFVRQSNPKIRIYSLVEKV